VITRLY